MIVFILVLSWVWTFLSDWNSYKRPHKGTLFQSSTNYGKVPVGTDTVNCGPSGLSLGNEFSVLGDCCIFVLCKISVRLSRLLLHSKTRQVHPKFAMFISLQHLWISIARIDFLVRLHWDVWVDIWLESAEKHNFSPVCFGTSSSYPLSAQEVQRFQFKSKKARKRTF